MYIIEVAIVVPTNFAVMVIVNNTELREKLEERAMPILLEEKYDLGDGYGTIN